MRIATFNLLPGLDVRSNRVDLDAVAEAIDALDVDVVAVQEVDRGLSRSGELDQVAELASRLGRTGAFAPALLGDPTLRWIRGPGADPDPGGPAYGIGLISRLPLTAVAISALPGGGPGQARPRRPDARRPPIPYRDGEPRAAAGDGGGAVGAGRGHDRAPVVRAVARPQAARHGRAVRAPRAGRAGRRRAPRRFNLPPRVVEPGLRRGGWRTLAAGPTFPSWCPVAQLDHVLVRGAVAMDDLKAGGRAE